VFSFEFRGSSPVDSFLLLAGGDAESSLISIDDPEFWEVVFSGISGEILADSVGKFEGNFHVDNSERPSRSKASMLDPLAAMRISFPHFLRH